jgi:hypothetical protein
MGNEVKKLIRRCPRLGGPVEFFYCKTCEREGEPCSKIIDCWWEVFDVQKYLEDHLSPDSLVRLNSRKSEPKINQLLKIIDKTKKRLSDP